MLAVDEIVVHLPTDWTPTALAASLAEHDAGTLLSSTRSAPDTDSILRALRWATSLVRGGVFDGGLELSRTVAELCTASVAWVATVEQALQYEVGRQALERGAPFAQLSCPPAALAFDLPEQAWVLALPDDAIQPTRVAFVGRPSTFRFTTSEILRVEALLQLVREMATISV